MRSQLFLLRIQQLTTFSNRGKIRELIAQIIARRLQLAEERLQPDELVAKPLSVLSNPVVGTSNIFREPIHGAFPSCFSAHFPGLLPHGH